MEYSSVHLLDLPDEMLMAIFKKLYNSEVQYSLMNVSQRLNNIVNDFTFTSHLTLFKWFPLDKIYPLSIPIRDRFCLEILPKINDKIKYLHLESYTMERFLSCTNYPNLCGLGLYGLQLKKIQHFITDENSVVHRFKNQISSLIIDITTDPDFISREHKIETIFTKIFSLFNKLQYLKFSQSLTHSECISFANFNPIMMSSTLLELHVSLNHIADCLYLLDGCFNQLQRLYVRISSITSTGLIINNKEKLPNLRCFSLFCKNRTQEYDTLIQPLLSRMLNLESLHLYLTLYNKYRLVNGDTLKTDILYNMPKLIKFTFKITSQISILNETEVPSNECIQNTFKDFKDRRIGSYVDYSPESKNVQCNIFTYPYRWTEFNDITNNFPGGLFQYVHKICLRDNRPFEYEFFIRIQISFPYLKELTVINMKPQTKKLCNNQNENLSIIKYPYLTVLNLVNAHQDYLEQFLLDKKTCLPHNVRFYVKYRTTKRVTHKFARDATRINCSKISLGYEIYINQFPNSFESYFLDTFPFMPL